MADYNAFISYRHKPRDIEVAQEVQKQLERFHIPKDLRKKYGINRIERVFRDKEELPTTSNLTDDIENALDNSDYLIVICTPATKESRWIEREINLFLEHHDQGKVMTVLAEGEPGDVIPPRLLVRKKKVIDSEGRETEITEELEPLSCDYRMDFRKARKIELPRLLSVMIGCSYDELMRRRQQYMMRRIGIISAIVTSALAIFIGYLIWSRNQIQKNFLQAEENLRQSRINQSRFLSSSALDALDNHDRILAIQLALEAMPTEENPRPLTAEAEYALSTSLGLYSIGGTLDYSAAKQYEADSPIREMIISPDGESLAVMDEDKKVYLWNLVSGEKLLELPCEGNVSIYDAGESGFLLVYEDHLSLLSWKDGSECFTSEKDLLPYRFTFDKEEGFASCYGGSSFYRIDLTGKILDSVASSSITLPENYLSSLQRYLPEKHLLCVIADETGNFFETHQKIVLYDYESGKSSLIPEDFRTVEEIFLLKNGNLLIAEYENTYSTTTTSFLNGTTFYDMAVTLTCINPDTLVTQWKETLHYTQAGNRYYRLFETEKGKEYLLISLSNLQFLIDPENGTILHRSEWPDDVVEVIVTGESMILSVLRDGSFAVAYPDDSSADTMITHLISDISLAKRAWPNGDTPSFMVVPVSSNRVIQFDSTETSPAYTCLFPLDTMDVYYSSFDENLLSVYGKDGEEYRIHLYDLSKDEEIMELLPEDSAFESFGFLTGNRFCYIFQEPKDKTAGKITDLSSGRTEDILLPLDEREYSELITARKEDNLFYAGKIYDSDQFLIGACNLTDDTSSSFEPEKTEENMFLRKIFPLADNHILLAYTADSFSNEIHILLGDLENKTVTLLEDTFPDSTINPASDENCFAIRTRDGVKVYDYSGTLLLTLPLSINTVPSFAFHDNALYVLTSDGTITKYDKEGNVLFRYEGESNISRSERNSYLWHFNDNTLTLFSNDICEKYDLSRSKCLLSASNVMANDEANSRLIVLRSDNTSLSEIGAFHIFSPEELVEEARNTVGNITLSEETRNRYGLD